MRSGDNNFPVSWNKIGLFRSNIELHGCSRSHQQRSEMFFKSMSPVPLKKYASTLWTSPPFGITFHFLATVNFICGPYICFLYNWLGDDDMRAYRYNKEKTLTWLQKKVNCFFICIGHLCKFYNKLLWPFQCSRLYNPGKDDVNRVKICC